MIEQTLAQRNLASRDPAIRVQAVDTLSKRSTAESLQRLSVVLADDPEPAVRAAAAQAIGRMGRVDGTPSLFGSIRRDTSLEVRASAVRAIGAIKDPASVPGLIDIWRTFRDSDDSAIHIGCAEALKHIGATAVPELLKALTDANWRVRYGAVTALRAIGGSGLKQQIAPLAEDSHILVRTAAQLALKELP